MRRKPPWLYEDDRHVCLVSGSRGDKGVGVIVPTLCFWPGSAIIVDPKSENASVTARRRGAGSDYAHAMGQKVCILDPFGEVQLEPALKARYNPALSCAKSADLKSTTNQLIGLNHLAQLFDIMEESTFWLKRSAICRAKAFGTADAMHPQAKSDISMPSDF